MDNPDKTILRKDDKRSAMKTVKSKPLPNRLAAFKFPPKVDPNVVSAYADRKVNLINRKKFVNRLTANPADEFIGSLKIF